MREIARLYSDDKMSMADIRKQFGIGDSSLYRALQKQGVALRGRGGAPVTTPTSSRNRTATSERLTHDGRTRTVSVVPTATRDARAATNGAVHRFRVEFMAVQRFDAPDIHGALVQAQSVGAMDILAITREG